MTNLLPFESVLGWSGVCERQVRCPKSLTLLFGTLGQRDQTNPLSFAFLSQSGTSLSTPSLSHLLWHFNTQEIEAVFEHLSGGGRERQAVALLLAADNFISGVIRIKG